MVPRHAPCRSPRSSAAPRAIRRHARRRSGQRRWAPWADAQARDILTRVTDAFFALDQAWHFTYVNPEGERLLGRRAPELVGHILWTAYPDIAGTPLGAAYQRAMVDGVATTMQNFYGPLDRWFEVRLYPAPDGLSVYFRDITAQRDAEARLRQSETRYRHLVEQVPAVIYSESMAEGDPITYMSPFVEELLGDSPEAFVADRSLWSRRIHPDDFGLVEQLTERANRTMERYTAEYRMVARDGHVVWVHDSATPVLDGNGQLVGWQGVVRDITARKDIEDELRRLAHRDPLTGLSNRAFLGERLAQMFATQPPGTVAVLFIDLDRFKLVNDTHGHTAGDAVLAAMAQGLSLELGARGTISRFGGDEFVAVIPETSEAEAVAIAERLLAVLRRPVPVAGRDAVVGGSVGIAFNQTWHGSVSDVTREASLALRSAKGTGRNRVVQFAPDLDLAGTQATLIADLRGAVERQELRLHYQPVIDLATGTVAAIESLLRWQHPRRGLVPPAGFLPHAEEAGLIGPIGGWVIEEACRQLGRWDDEPGVAAPLQVAVNVAAGQLADPAFPDRVGASLARHGLAADRLRLEVSERTTPDDLASAGPVIDALHARGVRLALDDFGTGTSSLIHLGTLRAAELKLDPVFIRRLTAQDADRIIVTGITALAHALGMVVTAEGIETPEQVRTARDAGCDRIQGHYVAPAMTPEETWRWLVDRSPSIGPDSSVSSSSLPALVTAADASESGIPALPHHLPDDVQLGMAPGHR